MLYFWLKLIHIFSATLLFGTGLGSAFYMLMAHLSKDNHAIAFTVRNVVLADWLFTTPTIFIQPITGFWLVMVLGYPVTTPWILISFILFILAGLCWLPVVFLQIKIRELAKQALVTNETIYLNPTYRKYFAIWFILGWPAFIALVIVFYLMVFKHI